MADMRPEVQSALRKGLPVVALESALITHGLPWPRNLEVARSLAQIVRDEGGIPATIGIIGGRIKVGLSESDLERLARSAKARKVSGRDIPIAVAKGQDGGTTVAATMFLAHQAGIQVFATGGIGGVHRGHPSDVSADLPELARTPVAVISAGAKALLDLPLTLEWLETHGVPVLGYGTDELPAFYSKRSGLPLDCRVDSPEEAAQIIATKWKLGLTGGVLVAVPIPAEAEMEPQVVERVVGVALAAAKERGIKGKALTPFILAQISQLTEGRSLEANVALLRNNAAVATEIATALLAIDLPEYL